MWDSTTHAVLSAVDGLARRAEVRAHNVANAETPGFRARHVDFESTLTDAINRGRPQNSQAVAIASPTIIGPNGNSVDMQTEMVGEIKDGLHREAMTVAFNFKTSNLRMAIAGRR